MVDEDINAFLEFLGYRKGGKDFPINKLKEVFKKADLKNKSKNTAHGAAQKLAKFDPTIRVHIENISAYLMKAGMTTKQLHEELDENKDGEVDRREFVTHMVKYNIQNIYPRDLGSIFEALDLNGDGVLSPDEFALYLEGAKLSRD